MRADPSAEAREPDGSTARDESRRLEFNEHFADRIGDDHSAAFEVHAKSSTPISVEFHDRAKVIALEILDAHRAAGTFRRFSRPATSQIFFSMILFHAQREQGVPGLVVCSSPDAIADTMGLAKTAANFAIRELENLGIICRHRVGKSFLLEILSIRTRGSKKVRPLQDQNLRSAPAESNPRSSAPADRLFGLSAPADQSAPALAKPSAPADQSAPALNKPSAPADRSPNSAGDTTVLFSSSSSSEEEEGEQGHEDDAEGSATLVDTEAVGEALAKFGFSPDACWQIQELPTATLLNVTAACLEAARKPEQYRMGLCRSLIKDPMKLTPKFVTAAKQKLRPAPPPCPSGPSSSELSRKAKQELAEMERRHRDTIEAMPEPDYQAACARAIEAHQDPGGGGHIANRMREQFKGDRAALTVPILAILLGHLKPLQEGVSDVG